MCLDIVETTNPEPFPLEGERFVTAYKLFREIPPREDFTYLITPLQERPVNQGQWHYTCPKVLQTDQYPYPNYPSGFHSYRYLVDAQRASLNFCGGDRTPPPYHVRQVYLKEIRALGTEFKNRAGNRLEFSVIVAGWMKVGKVVPLRYHLSHQIDL